MTKPTQAPRGTADAPPRASAHLTADGTAPGKKKRRSSPPMADALPIMTRSGGPGGPDPEERRQPQVGGRGTRDLSVTPESYDASTRTVEAILSAGSPVRRYYFTEELEISAEAIDLSRVERGICPLLDTHNQYELNAVIGRISNVRIENNQLIGTLNFSDTEIGRAVEARVAAGELRAISIGYRVTKWQITATDDTDHETWRAVAWELLEASLVPVPADPNAVVRSAPGTTAHGSQEEEDMRRNLPGGAAATAPAATTVNPTPAPVAPAARTEPVAPVVAGVSASRILELCGRTDDLGHVFASDLIRANESTPFTEADLLGRISERLITARARPNVDVRAGATGTESDGYRQALEDAVTLRANPGEQLDAARLDAAREFRGMTMMEMARDYLGRTGIRTSGMGRLDIAGQALGLRYGAMTTSDFANALSSATNRRVRAAFAAAPQTFRPFVSIDTLPDFKPTQIIGLGDAPALLLVPENGEFKRGAITDSGLTYRLQTYGRVIAISRQAVVNDDKDLFGRIPTMFGRKAADLESDLVYGILLSNPVMGDGVTMFHASHGNLAASGGAITVTTVAAGEQAMLTQRNDDGGYLNIRPQFLIVGPAKKVEAQQFLTAVSPQQQSAANPYPGTLTLIIDPRITGNQWFLASSPDAFDTIALAHLDGQEELFTETRVGFDVDGVETKARLDVGAAAIDYRGFYKNPGN